MQTLLELLLLDEQIDLTLQDKRGRTAIDLARITKNSRMLEILLHHDKIK